MSKEQIAAIYLMLDVAKELIRENPDLHAQLVKVVEQYIKGNK